MLIEGYTLEEILEFPEEQLDELVLTDAPLVLEVGSAKLLGQFRLRANRLVVELAKIEGGGEGVLPQFWLLVERAARKRELEAVEWIVHAIHCAEPNLKLRRVLLRLGFTIQDVPGVGEAYYYLQHLSDPPGAP